MAIMARWIRLHLPRVPALQAVCAGFARAQSPDAPPAVLWAGGEDPQRLLSGRSVTTGGDDGERDQRLPGTGGALTGERQLPVVVFVEIDCHQHRPWTQHRATWFELHDFDLPRRHQQRRAFAGSSPTRATPRRTRHAAASWPRR